MSYTIIDTTIGLSIFFGGVMSGLLIGSAITSIIRRPKRG